MYKIGEFSRIVGMTVKALRYYDEIDLLRPSMIDEQNGYRYYNDESYKRAIYIKILKKYQFTIKEIQDVINNIKSDDDLADYLDEKRHHIEEEIHSMKKVQQMIDKEIEQLKEVKKMMEKQKIEVLEVEDQLVASIRFKGVYQDVGKYLGKLYKVVGMKGTSAPFSMYYDEEYTEENADIEVCVPIKDNINKGEVTSKILKGGRFIVGIHIGPYDTLSNTYKAIADYAKEHGYEMESPSREIYEKGPGMLFKGNPDKYETKIMFKISE